MLGPATRSKVDPVDAIVSDVRRPDGERLRHAINTILDSRMSPDDPMTRFRQLGMLATSAKYARWNAERLPLPEAKDVLTKLGVRRSGLRGKIDDASNAVFSGGAHGELKSRLYEVESDLRRQQLAVMHGYSASFPYVADFDEWVKSIGFALSFGHLHEGMSLDLLTPRSEEEFRRELLELRHQVELCRTDPLNAEILVKARQVVGITQNYNWKRFRTKVQRGEIPNELAIALQGWAVDAKVRLQAAWMVAWRFRWAIATDLEAGI